MKQSLAAPVSGTWSCLQKDTVLTAFHNFECILLHIFTKGIFLYDPVDCVGVSVTYDALAVPVMRLEELGERATKEEVQVMTAV